MIPAINNIYMPKQTNWSPTISGVYDVFGNGKTALRAGFRHFVAAATDGLASTQQVASGQTANLPWTDFNNDNVVQSTITHTAAGVPVGCAFGPGCEITSRHCRPTSARKACRRCSADIKRPFYNQINVGVVHELAHGVSLSVEWFRTASGNITATGQNTTNLAARGDHRSDAESALHSSHDFQPR